MNRDDDMAYPQSLYETQSWSEGDMRSSIARSIKDPAAADLLSHILQPDPSKRWSTEQILDHMFFNPEKHIDEGAVATELNVKNESQQRMHSKIDKVQEGLDEVNLRTKEILSKTVTLTHMAKATQEKLDKSTLTICKAVFEAIELSTPTCFLILPYEHGKAADEGGVAAEYAEKMARLDDLTSMAARPLDSLKSAVSSVDAADKTMDKLSWFAGKVSAVASNPLQAAQDIVQEELKKIADSYTGKTLYFYLIDEITAASSRRSSSSRACSRRSQSTSES